VNIENKPASLVVNSSLYCDSLININLSLTQNIIDNNPPTIVSDASIEIMNKDSVILDVPNYNGNGNYLSWVKAEPGKRYLFRIQYSGKTYWGDETIPDTLKAELSDTGRIIFQGKQNFFQLKLKINDYQNSDNYYGLRLKRTYDKYSGSDTVQAEEWINIETIEFILTENPESRFSKKHLLFSDRYFNGIHQELKFGSGSLFSVEGEKTKALTLYVSSYSLNAYKYYTSVNEHLLYQSDPFSQPTVLKGNIEHAYGSIVAQNTKVFELSFAP
jgi:hypothetical protein